MPIDAAIHRCGAAASAPEVGLIVKHDGRHWVDSLGRPWDAQVKFSLPDKDVFVIDATASPPAQVAGHRSPSSARIRCSAWIQAFTR